MKKLMKIESEEKTVVRTNLQMKFNYSSYKKMKP